MLTRLAARVRASRLVALPLALILSVAALSGAAYAGHFVTGVTSTISARMATSQTSTLDLGNASYAPLTEYAKSFTSGTGNGAVQIVFADSGTIAASDSVLIDLAGATPDAFGTTIACVTGKGIIVKTPSTNTNDVLVGGATVAQTAFLQDTSDVVPVGPDGVFMLVRPNTGWTITGGSRDKMRLKNSGAGTTVKYTIQVLCR